MSDFARFEQAHGRLFSLVTDPEGKRFSVPKTHAQRQQDMQEAMARTADFLAFAGHPEARFPSVHVTGTSGKGSVTMMISALLRRMGYRTGTHTSPYLQLPTEKLIVDGQQIGLASFADLIEQFEEIHKAWGEADGEFTRLRYTEAWTAITFLWLGQNRLDWGVVEAGMGGRLDPTNLMPSKLAVITNVAMDHVKSLGPALTDIAHHKAGIIKPGQPVITAVLEPELFEVVAAEAQKQAAPLYRLLPADMPNSAGQQCYSYEVHDAETISVHTPTGPIKEIVVGAPGYYQLGNAALAISALDVMRKHGLLDRPIPNDGLVDVSCPGRMEIVDRRPLTILDGAHNPHKMRALVKSLQLSYPGRRIVAIVGGIVNKEIGAILTELAPCIDQLVATAPQVPGKPAVPPQSIAEQAAGLEGIAFPVATAATAVEAVALARQLAGEDDIILVTGSLYLVGETREIWFPIGKTTQ